MIVTIATIALKSVRDHSDQMDTSLLTIPTIVTILVIVIAGIGSASIPATASAIVMIPNDHMAIETIIWTQARAREQSEQSSYLPRCIAVQVHFMLILISCQKIRSWKFFERLERLNGHDLAFAQIKSCIKESSFKKLLPNFIIAWDNLK